MKLNRHFCLVAAVALASGCGDLDFDVDLSQSSEPPVQVSRQVTKSVPLKDEEPQHPIQAPAENPVENHKVSPPETVQPAPAPVAPGSGGLPENPTVDPETPKPVTQPTEPKVQPEENPNEPKDVTLKLISDDIQQNLEALNMALNRWIAAKGILPERLEQLVMEEFLPMLPMEPVGKKFAIDRKNKVIILVGQ